MIIRGNTVGFLPTQGNWAQTDETAADFIRGREAVISAMADAASHAGYKNNPHSVTAAQIGAAEKNHSHTAAEVGGITQAEALALIRQELGVIEHGAY